jgi:hypothetical protein
LDHHSNCPVDGFHPSFSWNKPRLSETFLLVIAAFFFTVAVAPASGLTESLVVSRSLSDEIFRDGVGLVRLDLAEEWSSGITDSGVVSKASLEDQGSGGGSGSAVLAVLASLPENRGMWLLAVGPWIWSVIVWHSRPRWRRRVRRNRYVE